MVGNSRLDPIESAEIMELLSAYPIDMVTPGNMAKLQKVVTHFQGMKDKRYQILKLLNGKPTDNKMEVLYTFVQLQQAKKEKISQLDPQDFEPDIVEELAKGYLSKDKRNVLKQDLERSRKEAAKLAKMEDRERQTYERSKGKALDKIKIDKIDDTLKDLDFIDNQLAKYE